MKMKYGYVAPLQRVKNAYNLLEALGTQAVQDHQAILRDGQLSDEGRRHRRVELVERSTEKLRDLLEDLDDDVRRTHAGIAEALAPDGDAEPITALLREVREQRAWTRIERQLDAGRAPAELIADAGAAGDIVTLNVLRAELPAYVRSQKPAIDGHVNTDALVTELDQAIDRAIAPHLPANEREALEARFQVGAYERAARHLAERAAKAISGNRDPSGLTAAHMELDLASLPLQPA